MLFQSKGSKKKRKNAREGQRRQATGIGIILLLRNLPSRNPAFKMSELGPQPLDPRSMRGMLFPLSK